MATPKQTDPQFKLRLTPELKEAIELAAKGNNRTMNSEIIDRLEQSFDQTIDRDRLFSSRELFLWAVTKAHEFQKSGSAVAGDVADKEWMNDPDALLLASYAVISELIRDLVRLPSTEPQNVEIMLEQAKARLVSEIVHSGRAKWGDKDMARMTSGFIEPEE